MAKGYWIARNDVHDMETYKKYVAGSAAAFERFGGRFLVRGGQYTLLEGTTRPRQVVIEFPSYQAALDCYNSADYQAAAKIRGQSSQGDIVIIEGVA